MKGNGNNLLALLL